MSDSWKDDISLKIINTIIYFTFLGSNLYSVTLPSSGKETYITPAPWAFLVWPLIHILLLGTVIYQFFPAGKKIIIEGISWSFPLLGFFNATYVGLRPTNAYLAFIFSLFVYIFVTYIYVTLMRFYKAETYVDKLFVHLPFSLYHGWTIFLVFLSAFEAFGVNALTDGAGIWTKVFVCLTCFLLVSSAASYSRATPEGDLPASIVIAWCLWGIFAHQTSSDFVRWSTLAFAIIALLWVIDGINSFVRLSSNPISLPANSDDPPV